MNRIVRRTSLLLTLVVAAGVFTGCAEQIGDIDRTNDNKVNKAELLDGDWYIRQTVADVPAQGAAFFVGYTFTMEKIVWDVQEDYLIAYRAYEAVPGASDQARIDEEGDTVTTGIDEDGFNPDQFKGEPIAAYQITSHFDVQRGYNSATGEQTNVIDENSSDRPWYEREYMYVNWATNVVDNFFFLNDVVPASPMEYYVGEEEPNAEAFRRVYSDEGQLEYFDFTERHFMEPAASLCYRFGINDCTGQQVEVLTSVMRVPEESDYEPVFYGDDVMSKFGYFRTERITYDRRHGSTYSGRIFLANRHNIWEDTWQRDNAGNILRDEDNKRIARPFADRTPKPIVYHLSANFPAPLLSYAHDMAAEWDRAYRRTVAVAQGLENPDNVRPMFILCNNPVAEEAVYPAGYVGDECGEVGDEVRIGDLRYSVVYWVNTPQLAGPLGYGPSAPDPETGEIVSGTAYVYGASIDRYAESSLDLIRFINGDLELESIVDGDYIRSEVLSRLDGTIDPRIRGMLADPSAAQAELPEDSRELLPETALRRFDRFQEDLADGRLDSVRSGTTWLDRRFQLMRESGLDRLGMNSEYIAGHGLNPTQPLTDDELESIRPANQLNANMLRAQRDWEGRLARECVLFADQIDDSILGIARDFAGRTDYDQMWQEIRGLIFKAVMEHEVGHTIGLRHNFSGSWDSLNYHDEFWAAKREGYPTVTEDGAVAVKDLGEPETIADLYGFVSLTEGQIDARMREFQYSSIMDYSSAFNTDFGGIGKYDEAAIMFAYTTGADQTTQLAPDSARFNDQEWGYVEVWDDLPATAVDTFRDFEDVNFVARFHPLEINHYTTLLSTMSDGDDFGTGIDRLLDRGTIKYGELKSLIAQNDPRRPTEVPYMFCSDELRGTAQSCKTWDRGADPLEQTLDYIERYRTYHFFSAYRRDRLTFNPSTVGQRYLSRYFLELVDGYQRWLFWSRAASPTLSNNWTFAAFAGLNLLGEVLTTPNPGSYELVERDVLDPETGAVIETREVMQWVARERMDDAELYIPEGPGRPHNTQYDPSVGIYYWAFPQAAGHYWSYLSAVFALTSSSVSVTGVDVDADFSSYIIPPYLVFEDEITRLFNGLFLDNQRAVSPLAVEEGGEITFTQRPMLSLELTDGSLLNPEDGTSVDPGAQMTRDEDSELSGTPIDLGFSFSHRFYPALYGMALFSSSYSLHYQDQNRVFRLGSGETLDPAPGFDVVEFCDPLGVGAGQCYAALNPADADEPPAAAEMVMRAQRQLALWEEAVEMGDDESAAAYAAQMERTIEDMNLMRSMYDIFGRNF